MQLHPFIIALSSFLTFVPMYYQALDMKKGEGEAILRALIRKLTLRRGEKTLVVEFQIKLLTLIISDSGIR